MDPGDRERFLEALRRDEDFRAAVRRELLTEELLNLPTAVAALVDAVAQQRQDFTALSQQVADTMQQTISAVRQGFAQVAADLQDIRNRLAS